MNKNKSSQRDISGLDNLPEGDANCANRGLIPLKETHNGGSPPSHTQRDAHRDRSHRGTFQTDFPPGVLTPLTFFPATARQGLAH